MGFRVLQVRFGLWGMNDLNNEQPNGKRGLQHNDVGNVGTTQGTIWIGCLNNLTCIRRGMSKLQTWMIRGEYCNL